MKILSVAIIAFFLAAEFTHGTKAAWTIAAPSAGSEHHTHSPVDATGDGDFSMGDSVMFEIKAGNLIEAYGTQIQNGSSTWEVQNIPSPTTGFSCGAKTGLVYLMENGSFVFKKFVNFTTSNSGC